MNRILIILFAVFVSVAYSQSSEKYNSEYENFYRAEELFVKEQYAAARIEFRAFIDGFDKSRPNDPSFVKAQYYEAVSALELYNNDAVTLLEAFNRTYPESIYKMDIYFRLGKFYYQKKDFEEALAWFNRLSADDIDEEDREEFYFKLGYSNFQEKHYEEARSSFHEVKDGISEYAPPALYYYSHIAYMNKNYQVALEGFLKLENDEKFGKVVPYYIAQIYYLQGKYDEVTQYADRMTNERGVANERDMNQLIGDAYYRVGKYDEAVPFLEEYNKMTQTSREDDYRLGYAYYRSKLWKKAVDMFDKVKKVEDSLGQIAFYHIGECFLKMGNKVSARSAFEGAAFINADPKVQEDALFNFAILSYQLDINPYDEAVEAFELYLSRYPNSERRKDVYQYLVNVYLSTNNYAKALASLDKIENKDIKLKMAYQLIAYNQGVERHQNSDYPGAISSFALVPKYPIDPDISARATFWTADAHYRLRNFDKAISGWKDFALLAPGNAPELHREAQYNLGYAYLSKDDLPNATQAFDNYVKSNPPGKAKKAEAYMRLADCYYVRVDNKAAIDNYASALALHAGFEDQALFYMAKTYGYDGQPAKKISSLLDIVNNYKDSKYMLTAVYEVAVTYNGMGELDKAMQYFNKIIFDYPSSNLVVESKLNVADIYLKKNNHAKAEEMYNELLAANSSNNDICKQASRGLIEIYSAQNNPEKVQQLAQQYPCADFTANEQEDLYYLPAMKEFDEENYSASIPLFERYLQKFPTGRYAIDVRYFLADAHYEVGHIEQAVNQYIEALKGPDAGRTEVAASRVAHNLYEDARYEEVIPYYERILSVSSDPSAIFNAQLGLMRSSYLTEHWQGAAKYADKVLQNGSINNAIKLEGYYARGMANYKLNHFDLAKTDLVWVIKNTSTEKAAEARFSLADVFYKQNHLDASDDEITALLKQKPQYNFWIAKGLILRTRIQIKQDKLVEAEQTLKSVIDHYPVPDDGILDEANTLWDELMQLKNQPKNLVPMENPTIEINENGNGE